MKHAQTHKCLVPTLTDLLPATSRWAITNSIGAQLTAFGFTDAQRTQAVLVIGYFATMNRIASDLEIPPRAGPYREHPLKVGSPRLTASLCEDTGTAHL